MEKKSTCKKEKQKQCEQEDGCWGWAHVACWPAGRGQKGQEAAVPASGCQELTVWPMQPWTHTMPAEEARQRSAAPVFTDHEKNKHPINLWILFYFATQKLLLSTQTIIISWVIAATLLNCILTVSLSLTGKWISKAFQLLHLISYHAKGTAIKKLN